MNKHYTETGSEITIHLSFKGPSKSWINIKRNWIRNNYSFKFKGQVNHEYTLYGTGSEITIHSSSRDK